MREIVSPEQAVRIVAVTAAALIALGIVGGAVAAAVARPRRAGLMAGALVALAGALVYGLWVVYNALIGRLGLDSVTALLTNLAIFVVVGLIYGLIAGSAWRWAVSRARLRRSRNSLGASGHAARGPGRD
jgi:uncharacterized membrane protein